MKRLTLEVHYNNSNEKENVQSLQTPAVTKPHHVQNLYILQGKFLFFLH